MVGQHEGAHLDGVHPVGVVAEEPGHGVAPDLLELLLALLRLEELLRVLPVLGLKRETALKTSGLNSQIS